MLDYVYLYCEIKLQIISRKEERELKKHKKIAAWQLFIYHLSDTELTAFKHSFILTRYVILNMSIS